MLYVVAFLCPPLAVLLTGRPFLAVFVLFLSLVYFPGALVALLVVSGHYNASHLDRALRGLERDQREHDRRMRTLDRELKEAARRNRQLHKAQMKTAALEQKALKESAVKPPPEPELPEPAAEPVPPGMIAVPPPTMGDRVASVLEQTRAAYDSLPEWGQPVVWGLAAATPVVMLMVAMKAMR